MSPLFADHTAVAANRIDVTVVDKVGKKVLLIKMYLWVGNCEKKSKEKTSKYDPLWWELQMRYRRHCIKQYNIVIDVLGVYPTDVKKVLRDLV